jgi:glutamine cyclotransferase
MARLHPFLILALLLTSCARSSIALPPPTAAPTISPTVTSPAPTPIPAATPVRSVEVLRYRVVMTYPHDVEAFTQGLVYTGDRLFESTGLRGRSSLREVDLPTGRVLRRVDVPAPIFAEGLALIGDELIQITWQESVAIRYDRDTFTERGRWNYAGEGWGLTHDGSRLIMSDGSAILRFRDPRTFEPTGAITVTLDGEPIGRLNELEWIDGMIWANVWQTDLILRIDPSDGMVTGVLDLEGLLSPAQRASTDVLNGIAWNPRNGRMLVTGKLWPHLFEIEVSGR